MSYMTVSGQLIANVDLTIRFRVDLNIMQFNMPFGKPLGLVTGMGFKWNNYWFDGNNNIMKDPVTRIIVESPAPAGVTYAKSKLNTFYLTVPLIFEVQFGPKKKGFISIGVIGDLKLCSNTKVKYYTGGSKQKEKVKSDFNLSPLRYHLTARAGYKFVKIFANYSMVPMFKEGMGPELYPVTVASFDYQAIEILDWILERRGDRDLEPT